MQFSISIEAMFGLNWSLWKQLIAQVEESGFDGLFRSDHFMVGQAGPDSLELVTSLTYLASHSRRLHFGSLVSPLSFRHPVMLARQAMAINDLSGGRMILGVGAGWHDEEHRMFGYPLGSKKTRFDRFEEGLRVIDALVRRDEPANFAGRFFQLDKARLVPRSPVRILIGGNGPTRTLPLAARYADVWNGQYAEPGTFQAINRRLDELVREAGREPACVKRTVMLPALVVRSEADVRRHTALIRQYAPPHAQSSGEEIIAWLRGLKGIIGSPQQVTDGLAAYAENGAEEVIVEWFGLHDLEGLALLGSALPR